LNKKTQAIFEERAKIIKAMAHPTRLFIIDQLSDNPKCVRELTELIGADVSTVSRHLSVLKNAGLVVDEKKGQQVFYNLKAPCVLNFFGCLEAVMQNTAKSNLKVLKIR